MEIKINFEKVLTFLKVVVGSVVGGSSVTSGLKRGGSSIVKWSYVHNVGFTYKTE